MQKCPGSGLRCVSSATHTGEGSGGTRTGLCSPCWPQPGARSVRPGRQAAVSASSVCPPLGGLCFCAMGVRGGDPGLQRSIPGLQSSLSMSPDGHWRLPAWVCAQLHLRAEAAGRSAARGVRGTYQMLSFLAPSASRRCGRHCDAGCAR